MKTIDQLKIALAAGLVAGVTLAPAAANAGETRSPAAVPRDGARTVAAPGQSANGQRSTSQGPRDGFPDNRGLDTARERASDNAAFKRNDSQG